MNSQEKIDVLNVNVPEQRTRVNAVKHNDMRSAVEEVTPTHPAGITAKEMIAAAKPHLPQDNFPGGKTSGWWQKTVQLDMEARGLMQRSDTTPLRVWLIK